MKRLVAAAAVLAWGTLAPSTEASVSLGTMDTFEDGTTQGWFAGIGASPPVPPHVVATGGPGGADDAYLLVTAQGGIGPGSRLNTMNVSQWAGNYTAAGISTIEMDVSNFGATTLTVRLLFANPSGGLPTAVAVTNAAAVLAPGSDWAHVVFPIDVGSLTPAAGTVAAALSAATELRIMHNADADGSADPIAGILGVDNISAGPPRLVPEPALVALLVASLGLAGVVLAVAKRRRAA
jgi:hypothetical protein